MTSDLRTEREGGEEAREVDREVGDEVEFEFHELLWCSGTGRGF